MTTRATTRATTRSTTRGINATIGGSGGSTPPPAWTPASLSNLRQWLADNYYSSPVGGLQVIESLETHGTVRAPEPGCCALFDGVNDYGYLGVNPIPLMASGAITVWIEPNGGSGLQFLVACRDPDRIYLGYSASNEIYITLGSTNFTNTGVTETTRTHVAVRWTGGTFWVYRNGVQIYTGAYSGSTGGTSSCIGAYSASGNNASANYFKGCIHDLRIYNAVKSEAELLAIYNTDFSNPDITGLWAGWYFNDRAGVVARDWSGNGHDLTLTGPITESTFWAEDSAITANPANVLGYTLSGSTIIPRNESDTAFDTLGGALGNTGLSPYPATIDTPCITFNGTSDYATLGARVTSGAVTALTVCLWVKYTGTGFYTFASEFHTPTNNRQWFLGQDSSYVGKVSVNTSLSGDNTTRYNVYGNTTINDGLWHHVAMVFNAGTIELYVDGVLQTLTVTVAGSVTSFYNGTAHFAVGAVNTQGTAANLLEGSLCNVRVYSSVKSGAEILAIQKGYDDRTSLEASWKCQEGPGIANDNLTLYDDSGNGNHLTVVGGTVSVQRANRCAGYVRDHAFEHGGRLDALGAFCPLVPGTALCADGNAATLSAGKRGNPYSKMIPSPFDAAELNKFGFTSATRIDSDETFDDASSIADTGFGRIGADGIDREFLADEALTGADLTNAQAYVA